MFLADSSPFPLAPEDRAHEERLRAALVGELYSRSGSALLALALVLVVLRYLLEDAVLLVPALAWVFMGLGTVILLRLALYLYLRLDLGSVGPRTLNLVFIGGVALVGLGFAAMNILAWPYLSIAHLGLLLVCHAGINSVAMETMAPSVWGYLAYMLLNMGSLFALCWRDELGHWPGQLHHLVLAILGIYIAALVGMACQAHLKLRRSLVLQFRLAESALHDSLTALRNRRYLLEFMDPESERVIRSWAPGSTQNQSLSLMMLDLDHFKRVNDTHGHGAGDAVLRQMGQLLQETVRKPDMVIRWGGEEFLVIARGADRGYALLLAERIREKVASHPFGLPDGSSIRMTCSLGFSLYPFSQRQPHLLGWEQSLELADASLYLAKAQGRDRAYGALAGEAPWEPPDETLASVAKDLEGAYQRDLVKLVGAKHQGR